MNGPEDSNNADTNGSRWTCELCGCVTNRNQDNPTSCSICGSLRQLPDNLRRDEPLSAQLMRRSFFGRRGGVGLDFQASFNRRSFEQVENDPAVVALALEGAGVSDIARIPGARARSELLIRSVEAIPFGLDAISSPLLPPDELLEIATENASLFNPHWEAPINLGMHRKENSLNVGDIEFLNIATLPVGASEGKSIRTAQPIPRVSTLSNGRPLRRKAIGFRVAFKRPLRETGKSLGGGYLVGVTTSSFSSFDERNSLQQSSLFWGIDDNGNKYEGGSADTITMRGSQRPLYGLEMNGRQVARNDDNVLYGCLETITVVVDTESRTLTFWRDGDILGTLVKNVPRSGVLYPVVVPFNAGAMVAITGLDGIPVLSLQQHECVAKQRKMEKEKARHVELGKQRQMLVRGGKPTERLETALRQVFSLYEDPDHPEIGLGVVVAARLWYRSGLKLKNLADLIERKALDANCLYADVFVLVDDFLEVVSAILTEDEIFFSEVFDVARSIQLENSSREQFEIGDVVELVEGYEKYGDASRGPMVPGDRGQVVEVQQGSNGERHSIRVLFNGRRWWYQPQTLLAEKSGLIATPAIWFIQRLLRAHGFDHLTLTPLWGKPVTESSWAVGDVVFPSAHFSCTQDASRSNPLAVINVPTVGRIVPPSSLAGSHVSITDRGAGIVCVEFVDSLFGLGVGIEGSASDERVSRFHRVKVADLVHAGFSQMVDDPDVSQDADKSNRADDGACLQSIPRDIMSISRLDVQAIESIANECDKGKGALARVFAYGLADSVLEAIAFGREMVRNNDDLTNLLPAVAALGHLLSVAARHLYHKAAESAESQNLQCAGVRSTPNSRFLSEVHVRFMAPSSTDGDSFNTPGRDGKSQSQELGLDDQLRTLTRRGPQMNEYQEADERHYLLTGTTCSEEPSFPSEGTPRWLPCPLSLYSSELHATRRGGFEALSPGEDARRGAPVLNTATKSAIANGIMSNHFAWFHRVVETAKRKKGSTSTASSLVNARDEDGMPLLALATHLGCSTAIVSYLMRNGAVVDDETIKLAAYLGQKNLLSLVLQDHMFVDGVVNREACSHAIVDTIENARKRQKDQELCLRREGEEFLLTAVRELIQFGIESRCSLAPKVHIYRCIVQSLVGRVLLRALHLNRLNCTVTASIRPGQAKPKGRDDAESGRVNIFPDNLSMRTDADSAQLNIASSEALLFSIPGDTLACRLFKACHDVSDCPLTKYLRLVEGLLWTKEVEDIALGLSLTSILLNVASLKDVSVTLHRFGVSDLIAFHQRESLKRLEALHDINKSLTLDGRRFSPHHVAAREPEVKSLVSSGVVLCPKCHPAELHLTRHSSFRCDLCGNGVDRGFPMHGCRECDWDACEDCIDVREGGIVKWKYVQLISRECALAIDCEKCDNIDSSTAQLSAKDWSLQTTSARIKALDVDVLKELAAQLASPGALTMFEFSNHILPVLREALCGDSSVVSTAPVSQYDPPMKKRKPQFRTNSKHRPCFVDKFITTLVVQPVVQRFEVEVTDHESKQGDYLETIGQRNVDPNTATEGEIPICIKEHTPEILRRLHVLLSFFEKLPRSKVILTGTKETSDDLRSLTKPWTIEVIQYDQPFVVNCEPLMQLSCLKNHLLRSAACRDAAFVSYCQRLAEDKAIIAESRNPQAGSSFVDSEDFRLGQVVDFDPKIGVHRIKYATKNLGEVGASNLRELHPDIQNLSEYFEFDSSEECVLLGCKTFIVLQRFKNAERDEYKVIVECVLKSRLPSDVVPISFPPSALPRGTRVEKGSKAYTIIGCSPTNQTSSRHAFEYDLVSDSGEVIRGIPHHDLKCGLATESRASRVQSLSERVAASSRDRSFRMIALRSLASGDEDTDHQQASDIGVLKRSWSALSLLDQLSPIDLNVSSRNNGVNTEKSTIKCSIAGKDTNIVISASYIEKPPQFRFLFGVNDRPYCDLGSRDITLVSAFQQLSDKMNHHDSKRLNADHKVALYFSLDMLRASSRFEGTETILMDSQPFGLAAGRTAIESRPSRGYDLQSMLGMGDVMEEIHTSPSWSDVSETMTLNCMQLIDSIGRYVHERASSTGAIDRSETHNSLVFDVVEASLESRSLTDKLSAQLDQSLAVVSGVLPPWCTALPSLAPRLFSYDSRRQLLERTAFGVSRAAMRLQEAKVNVGPLRQRMAALRGRAVELVTEAFSGGAEDPTALQLQADELYGMEEALGARVHAAFRAQGWRERSLQCAKAAVRRDKLLLDAATVMERYAGDSMIRQRRLEIRFSGESGFDAASGDEAGVTRGFFADVAEALLCCQHVSPSTHPPSCPPVFASSMQTDPVIPTNEDLGERPSRLPLWIPDLDSTSKVVIPTPRANLRSTPGVYPRPLSQDDPQIEAVKEQFRFMGRVFACALRERFMFPLPLSCSFLRLVQIYAEGHGDALLEHNTGYGTTMVLQKAPDCTASRRLEDDATDEYSLEENTPTTGTVLLWEAGGGACRRRACDSLEGLVSLDLPRPGFLGGEVYAVEQHICTELDVIDALNLSEAETAKRYAEVAANPKFAQKGFGKSYECSFEEFMEGKTFVDPLDTSQGPMATPLCANGHEREVNIFNVREWVRLAKQFILVDGVIEQAKAFREGVDDFFPTKYLRLFTVSELQRDVCGGSDNVDNWNEADIKRLLKVDFAKGAAEALVGVAAIGGEGGATISRRFGSSSPTISFLSKTLLESTPTQRRQFLNFVTSVPIVTPGEIEVVPILSPSGEFLPLSDNCLPRANTCARRLYLPKFESFESFSSVLWSVIKEESRFKGFYEWRG